jgi:hypothetical protein
MDILRRVYESTDSPISVANLVTTLELDEKIRAWHHELPMCFKPAERDPNQPVWLDLQSNIIHARYVKRPA